VTSVASLAAELEPSLSSDGVPARPLVIIPFEHWRTAPPSAIADAARLVGEALPVTAGVLEGPPSPALTPLIEAATLTLAACGTGKQTGPSGPPESAHSGAGPLPREVIPVGDLGCSLDEAVARLEAAVARSPRAAVACGQLVRQTAALAPQPGAGTTAALAAEAAAYSLLLGGPEFARWLAERGASRRREPPPEPVHLTREGAGLLIVLDDPGRRNAFSARMREALFDAMVLAQADDTIGSVTLRGTGPAFCAGGDLDEFGTAEDLVAAYMVRLARAPWRKLDRIAHKVTVYAHGACVGAGTEISAYAGRVVAAPDAFFALPEVQMGLVPGAGGSVSVPRRIGRWRAAWLMLTGDRLPAPAALRWGLADDIAEFTQPVPADLRNTSGLRCAHGESAALVRNTHREESPSGQRRTRPCCGRRSPRTGRLRSSGRPARGQAASHTSRRRLSSRRRSRHPRPATPDWP
jgi:enoyl-CoA hydratase/carnithine racemase